MIDAREFVYTHEFNLWCAARRRICKFCKDDDDFFLDKHKFHNIYYFITLFKVCVCVCEYTLMRAAPITAPTHWQTM